MEIQYHGKKQRSTAFQAETGIVWLPLAVHDIQPLTLAERMLGHPDVFRLPVDEGAKSAPPPPPAPASVLLAAAQVVLQDAQADQVPPDAAVTLTADQVRAAEFSFPQEDQVKPQGEGEKPVAGPAPAPAAPPAAAPAKRKPGPKPRNGGAK